MIQPEELRIGNWIQTEGGRPVRVNSIFGDRFNLEFINHEPYSSPLTEMEPIPLTPELLEKIGFVLVNGIYWTLNRISLEQIENDPEYFDVTRSYGTTSLDITVQYLHELQNLYFALIGSEIEINL
jgi:hypothetical protein